ncbi:LPXTG cell wall anchor domain-containing protein, partial [Acinetobacter baumannii]
ATAASAAGSQVVKHVVPVKKPIVDNTPTPTEDSSGMSNTILAVIVGAVLALLAFFGYRFTRKTPPPAKPLTSGATPNARPEASGTDAPVRVA